MDAPEKIARGKNCINKISVCILLIKFKVLGGGHRRSSTYVQNYLRSSNSGISRWVNEFWSDVWRARAKTSVERSGWLEIWSKRLLSAPRELAKMTGRVWTEERMRRIARAKDSRTPVGRTQRAGSELSIL